MLNQAQLYYVTRTSGWPLGEPPRRTASSRRDSAAGGARGSPWKLLRTVGGWSAVIPASDAGPAKREAQPVTTV
jgi:hypothetical protein